MILILVLWHLCGKFNVGGGKSFTEVAGSELGPSISLDLSDSDVFNSDRVITWSCEIVD
jgi:hypothetical protein